jgi:hypothetical protein
MISLFPAKLLAQGGKQMQAFDETAEKKNFGSGKKTVMFVTPANQHLKWIAIIEEYW